MARQHSPSAGSSYYGRSVEQNAAEGGGYRPGGIPGLSNEARCTVKGQANQHAALPCPELKFKENA